MTPDFAPTTDLEHARRRCFAYLGEIGPEVVRDAAVRRKFVSYVIGKPVTSMSDWDARKFDWTARRLAEMDDDRRRALLEAAVIETQPAVDTDALDNAMRQSLGGAEEDALLDRIGEVAAELLWSIGDAGNAVLAKAPRGSLKRDVLGEYLRSHETLKPILSSAAPVEGEIDPSAVTRWMFYARVAARVPMETRVEFGEIPYGYFACAATTLEDRNGIRMPPSLTEIERRLTTVAENETRFRKPSDLRRWLLDGSRTEADGSPVREDHPAAFRATAATLGVTAAACDALLAAFHVRAKRGTR